ncbi:hypothetical protein DRO30_01365, partial [Candidatus Bathyarchaeota archaeon]
LYDRFLLRFQVGYLGEDSSFISLLKLSVNSLPTISLQELENYQNQAAFLPISDTILESILKVRRDLFKEGIIASDRRWKQSLDVLKAYAFLEGKNEVDEESLMFLCHVLWSHPEQKKTILKIVGSVAAPWDARAIELYDIAKEIYDNAINAEDKEQVGIEANKKLKKLLDELADLEAKHSTEKIKDINAKVQVFQKEIIKKCLGIEL